MLEAISMCQEITGRELTWSYEEQNRAGDHIWRVSDVSKFAGHYPAWQLEYSVQDILAEIYEANVERWQEMVPQ